MKTLKVLFLDDAPWYHREEDTPGFELEVLRESELDSPALASHFFPEACDVYFVSGNLCLTINNLTANSQVDLIVVGNNLGAGVQKAASIADGLKAKTIVTWNYYNKGDETEYAELGFEHFCSRRDLNEAIRTLLGIVD